MHYVRWAAKRTRSGLHKPRKKWGCEGYCVTKSSTLLPARSSLSLVRLLSMSVLSTGADLFILPLLSCLMGARSGSGSFSSPHAIPLLSTRLLVNHSGCASNKAGSTIQVRIRLSRSFATGGLLSTLSLPRTRKHFGPLPWLDRGRRMRR